MCAEEIFTFAFSRKVVWQRIAIVALALHANFLLALVAFWIVFLAGERGLAPWLGMVEDSLAAQSGFESGTEIIAVDGVADGYLEAATRQLFGFIGTSGDIPFTVTIPIRLSQYSCW